MSNHDSDEFARRAGALLRAGAEQIDGTTRRALAGARAKALEAAQRPRPWLDPRYLVPAGAVASAALVAVLLYVLATAPAPVNRNAGAALYDMELLADADALDVGEEMDLEFIEWAAAVGAQEAGG